MNDNEIIKAMQQCNGWNGRCLNCPLNEVKEKSCDWRTEPIDDYDIDDLVKEMTDGGRSK